MIFPSLIAVPTTLSVLSIARLRGNGNQVLVWSNHGVFTVVFMMIAIPSIQDCFLPVPLPRVRDLVPVRGFEVPAVFACVVLVNMKSHSHGEVPFSVHLFTYRYEGASWVFQIKAASADDAKARLRHIAHNAVYDGEEVLYVPIPSGLSRVGRFLSALFGHKHI
jgi:hypothetical protein